MFLFFIFYFYLFIYLFSFIYLFIALVTFSLIFHIHTIAIRDIPPRSAIAPSARGSYQKTHQHGSENVFI
jgi:hypothetical protein